MSEMNILIRHKYSVFGMEFALNSRSISSLLLI